MRELPTRRFVARLIVLYLLDWIVILGTVGFAGSTTLWMTPNARPFQYDNPAIQFPFQTSPVIPSWLLVVLAVIMPAAFILVVTALMQRGSWRRALYTLNTAWLGLGLAIAGAMIITDGLKNLLGKPRPDMISRCDLDRSRLKSDRIGPGELVTWDICRTHRGEGGLSAGLDAKDLNDGFRSFPSGHCSMSMAGLSYFAIWIAEFVFRLPIPSLNAPLSTPLITGTKSQPRRGGSPSVPQVTHTSQLFPRFPIMFALLICSIPILLALYICSTRYTDFRHHPIDIVGGAIIGLLMGGFGWRWYGAWSCVAGEDGGVYRWMHSEKRDEEAPNDEDEVKEIDERRNTDEQVIDERRNTDEQVIGGHRKSFRERTKAKGISEPKDVYGSDVEEEARRRNGEGSARAY